MNYSRDPALDDGKGTVTATVTAAAGVELSYNHTVHFTTMALNGEGTEESPYLISNKEELVQLADCLNSGGAAPMDAMNEGVGNYFGYYFKLTSEICPAWIGSPSATVATPILRVILTETVIQFPICSVAGWRTRTRRIALPMLPVAFSVG